MLPVTAITIEQVNNCPIRQVLAKLNGKWQPLILLSLEDGPQRFNQMRRLIGDITQRVLTENLRSLERDGYVSRKVTPSSPPRVDYALTAMGQEFLTILKPLVFWATDVHPKVCAARNAYDAAQD